MIKDKGASPLHVLKSTFNVLNQHAVSNSLPHERKTSQLQRRQINVRGNNPSYFLLFFLMKCIKITIPVHNSIQTAYLFLEMLSFVYVTIQRDIICLLRDSFIVSYFFNMK